MTRDVRKCAGVNRRRACRRATRSRNRSLRQLLRVRADAPPDEPIQAYIPVEEDPIIVKAKAAAAEYAGSLPNFFCRQLTTRYDSDRPKDGWQAHDTITADLAYENGHENYTNIKVGNKAAKSMEDVGGNWSTGEFASMLDEIFDPGSAATFRKTGSGHHQRTQRHHLQIRNHARALGLADYGRRAVVLSGDARNHLDRSRNFAGAAPGKRIAQHAAVVPAGEGGGGGGLRFRAAVRAAAVSAAHDIGGAELRTRGLRIACAIALNFATTGSLARSPALPSTRSSRAPHAAHGGSVLTALWTRARGWRRGWRKGERCMES